ncbi:MAG: photosynthetic reaction center subunit H [Pseudomonadota bacterium]
MEDNAYIIGRIDLAQIALYAFWVFFIGLVFYLTREGMREGYPTVSEQTGKPVGKAFLLPMPGKKTFLRRDGSTNTVPEMPDEYELKAVPVTGSTGAAFTPTGDPLADGVGPAAWVKRPEWPDKNANGDVRIRPMRWDNEFSVASFDADPRGFEVICCDGETVGRVVDLWIDRAEQIIRYFEVETAKGMKLVPFNLSSVSDSAKTVSVRSVTSAQFLKAPKQKKKDEITLREEDQVMAYFTGGTLYATTGRTEPLL